MDTHHNQSRGLDREIARRDAGWSGQYLEEGAAVGHAVTRRSRGEDAARVRTAPSERYDVIVIGGGQAGLSAGYHLKQRGLSFVILDAARRVGDAWRQRWDSLRLFTPARFDGLDGMPFPAPATYFPTKDEMADYLEAYAAHFDLPVRSGVRVDRLSKAGDVFVVEAGGRRYEAGQVIVAMSKYQKPFVPDFAGMLDPEIVQLHSLDYRHPGQLRDGSVLLVGAANSAVGDRARPCPRTQGLSVRPPPGPCAIPHRGPGCAERAHSIPVPRRLPPHPHRQHADGPEGETRRRLGWRPAHPGQAEGSHRDRRRARAARAPA